MYCCIIEYNLIIKFECIIIKKKYVAHNVYLYNVAQSSQKVRHPCSTVNSNSDRGNIKQI